MTNGVWADVACVWPTMEPGGSENFLFTREISADGAETIFAVPIGMFCLRRLIIETEELLTRIDFPDAVGRQNPLIKILILQMRNQLYLITLNRLCGRPIRADRMPVLS